MIRIENDNKEALSFISAKLQKDYDKLTQKLSKSRFSTDNDNKTDSFTLGEKKNDKLIYGSLAVAGLPLAIGVGKATVGLISLIPSLAQPPNEEAVEFFEKAKDFSQNSISSGFAEMEKGLPLLLIPAGIAAVSLSVKLYKNLIKKKENEAKYDNAIINMIDDIMDNKEDPTLEFAKKLFKRVDLTNNDPKVNIELLKYMAYYRYILGQKQSFKVSQDEVDDVFDQMVLYIKNLKQTDKVSEDFKKSRFINNLIFDYDEKMNERYILGEATAPRR